MMRASGAWAANRVPLSHVRCYRISLVQPRSFSNTPALGPSFMKALIVMKRFKEVLGRLFIEDLEPVA